MNLKQFSKRIRIISNGVVKNVDINIKKAAIIIDRDVVLSTPVDTGRARSNWQVGVGSPATEIIEAFSPGSELGTGESNNASTAIQNGQAAIQRRSAGQDIYISNNLPYINSLNNGSSAQAPANFIQIAVLAGVSFLKRMKVVK